MIYKGESIKLGSELCEQVNRVKALRIYTEGGAVFFHPSNMRLHSMWSHPCRMQLTDLENIKGADRVKAFENLENSFLYYNCDSERGRYIHFFTPQPEQ